MLNSRMRFIILFGLLAVAAGCGSDKKEMAKGGGGRPKDVKAEGYILTPSSFQQDYLASGTLLPNEEIEIHPEMTGRVTKIHFKEGSFIKKGQLLISLYDADILAQIQKLKKQKALQQKLQERQKELLSIGGISQQDFESTETTIATLEADIATQEAQLRRTKILAPFDGVVGIRNISEGAVVSPTTTIALLKQVHPLKIDFSLPEQYYAYAKPGLEVTFTVAGIEGRHSGKISTIEPGADVTTRTIRVRAIVPNTDRSLVAGTFAEVTIPLQSSSQALLIPTQSVIPTTRDKKVVLVAKGKASLVTVKLGMRSEDKVEVVSGLKSGDTILTTGLMQVKEGMDVTITKTNG